MGTHGPISDAEIAADEADHALTQRLNGPPPGAVRKPRGIKATKTQDATTHHQRTHVSDLYDDPDPDYARDEAMREHEDWFRGDR